LNITQKIKALYNEFPPTFWFLVLITYIDHLGGSLVFPFFSLYVTQKFGVGMTQVGLLFTIFAGSGFVGGFMGGALTDKFGRRAMIIASLIISSISGLGMGLVGELGMFYTFACIVGLLGEVGSPAQQAIVADLLPENKRAEGYGIIRVAFNLSVTIGPAIGGLVASRSFLFLFIIDAALSLIAAVLAFLILPETRPMVSGEKEDQNLFQTMAGYGKVLRDRLFLAFSFVYMLMTVVYMQMNSTLSVFLRDVHGITPQNFGYIISMNAAMVVLFQFAITRRVSKYQPMIMMAMGSLFYAIGFGIYGFVASYTLFLMAMVLITIGEMIIAPVAQALVVQFSPEDMRGRYTAVFGLAWGIPWAVGPLTAGMVMDRYNPNWVWYGAGLLGLIATISYLWLHMVAAKRWRSMLDTSVGSKAVAVQ
jgi:MFS family permease